MTRFSMNAPSFVPGVSGGDTPVATENDAASPPMPQAGKPKFTRLTAAPEFTPGAGSAVAGAVRVAQSGAMWGPPTLHTATAAAAAGAAAYYPQQAQQPSAGEPVGGAASQSYIVQASQQPPPAGAAPVPNRYIPNVLPARRSVAEMSLSETRRQDLYQRCLDLLAQLPLDDPVAASLPQLVVHYHSLYPLDDGMRDRGAPRVLPVHSHAFKALSARDGRYYLLRRLDVPAISDAAAQAVVAAWGRIRHPNLVPLRELFTAKFGAAGHTGLAAHDFVAGAASLEERFIGSGSRPVDESTLWAITVQLLSLMRAVHTNGLACRVLDVSKVLMVGASRVYLNAVGIVEAVEFDQPTRKSLPQLQYEDLYGLGKLLLSLCCRSNAVLTNITQSLEYAAAHYSPSVKSFIVYLLSKPTPTSFPTLEDAISMTALQTLQYVDALRLEATSIEDDLTREMENGRLLRLLFKLGFINERPEFEMDASWSETGNRYPLKLFRDYVFHQVDADGAPVLDVGHVVGCLNRLDVGDPSDRCMLVSRDGQTALVASYADLRRCLEDAYAELEQRAAGTAPMMGHEGQGGYEPGM